MSRVWWDKRPSHLRDVAGWVDYHLPRIGRALMPMRCRVCRTWNWRVHKMDCAVGRELMTRVPVFWRTMVILLGVLVVEVAVIWFVLTPLPVLTVAWWVGFVLTFLFAVTAPFITARVLRDWWMPKR